MGQSKISSLGLRGSHRLLVFSCILLSGIFAIEESKGDEHKTQNEIEEVVVVARRQFLRTEFRPDRSGMNRDVSQLMKQVPGGAVNANGPLTGQVQYRGMSGPRVNVRVDGMLIHGGGPNWMAPPLHHIPTGLMQELVVDRGISSIGAGGGLGGVVTARWKKLDYAVDDRWRWGGDFEGTAGSVDDGTNISGMVGLSSDRHRTYILGSRDSGDDTESAGGRIASTRYERDAVGVGYGFSGIKHQVDLDWRRLSTDDTGTPSLPMDIDWFDTDLWNVGYNGQFSHSTVAARAYGSDIDHGMSNYHLRPAPDFSALPLPPFMDSDKRFGSARSNELGFNVSIRTPFDTSVVEIGVEGKFADHDMTITDPDAPSFFVENFNDSESEFLTVFGQWSANDGDPWYWELGAALQRVDTSTDTVDAMPARMVDMNPGMWVVGTPPRAVWALRERFNQSDRKHRDFNTNWVAKTRYRIKDEVIVELAASRVERSPLYLERYLWIPLEVNAGLGDGNNYVGNTELRPETAHQFELGLDVETATFRVSPRLFYRRVDDYIQGVPETDPVTVAVSGKANGDATPLRFANTDAHFWGADLEFGAQLAPSWRLEGIVSVVRAERRDINDDLYRIAPDSVRLAINYQRPAWNLRLEQVLTDRQDRISATNTLDLGNRNNSFEASPGYGLTNVFFEWLPREGLTVTFGVENLMDKEYRDHLTGFNRVPDGAAEVGRRLPGSGRNMFVRLHHRW